MKVHMLKADLGGSGTYRVEEPARAAQAADPGLQIAISTDIDVTAVQFRDGRVEVHEVLTDVDVIVFQRPLTQSISEVVRVARKQGIGVVIDVDDDFHNVHPDNVAAADVDPAKNLWHNRLWLTRCVKMAHVVTVSTPALMKYPDGNGVQGVVVRNRIPERALLLRGRPDVARTVGWTGTIQTHPHDIARARGVLGQTDAPFAVVGDSTGVADALGVPAERVTLAAGWTDSIDKYWQTVADSFGIGIAPLEPSKFNRAKSWLKPAEYCALGIPFVVSPTPEYQLIVAQSNAGLAASSATRWARSVAVVAERRDEYVRAGREWATKSTLESHIRDWTEAWQLAAELASA